jgi:Domain of unknown function (DUF4268)
MAIYKVDQNRLVEVPKTDFGSQGILERQDLQRLLRSQIQVLSPDLMVIAEEFGDWEDSNRRIDLLCLDREANFVVVELKRTQDGGHMELQAIRYAAMVSAMTFPQMVDAHAKFIGQAGNKEQAQAAILEFLGWDEPQEDIFGQDVRILLASADFGKELTTAVLWLNLRGLDIRCIRLKPHRMEGGGVLLDVQQLIPLPEASEYQTRVLTKDRVGREQRAERYDLRYRFWEQLLRYAATKTNLHATRTPGIYNWIGGTMGVRGIGLNYCVRQEDSQFEIYIDFGHALNRQEKNLEVFGALHAQKEALEAAFGSELEWQDLPDKVACRIRKRVEGGFRSPESEWPRIHQEMVDGMVRLDRAFRPSLQQLNG